jgi:hypothetical protein
MSMPSRNIPYIQETSLVMYVVKAASLVILRCKVRSVTESAIRGNVGIDLVI